MIKMASVILVFLWLFSGISICIATAIYLYGINIPQCQLFEDILLYGKARGKRKNRTVVQFIEVPKKWFFHFYILGAVMNGVMLYQLVKIYMLGLVPPWYLTYTLRFITHNHTVTTRASSAMLVIAMMFVQCLRRLEECIWVSVYSKDTMNLFHYLLAVLVYGTFHLVVLCEAQSLATARVNDVYDELTRWHHLVGIGLFVLASWQHHRIHVQLGNLRKNNQGEVTSLQHKLPQGGWFRFVSSPHFLMEMLIYVAMVITAGLRHVTLWSLVCFVILNQCCASLLTQKWYRQTYASYPKNRKAVIPFIL